MNTTKILFFDEINKTSLPFVGGKGANLGEMTKAGFPVPYGFCITTEVYKDFIESNDLSEFIAQTTRKASLENIGEIGEEIRKKLISSSIPNYLEQEIRVALNKFGEGDYFAVRSSATAEDLTFASFAGQQDTYLNIKGEKQILDAVRNCWASLFTDRAIMYRIQNKIEHEKVYMSVVVQKMVLPEISGIMFTADPVSGHRDIISIDASFGLGEALVSGIVSPDIYKFKKSTKTIEEKIIAVKKLAIMPVEGGGTKKIQLSLEKSKIQVVDDLSISRLAEIGMSIEKHYGCPQDIEWCLSSGIIYIVQSRAITSLFPLPEPLPAENSLHAYISFNHFQVMTDPISPLGIDILRIILPFEKGVRSVSEYKFLKTAAGRIYIDLSELLQYKALRKRLPGFLKNADALLGEALQELVNRPDFDKRVRKNKEKGKKLKKYMRPIMENTIKNLLYRKPESTINYLESYIENRVKETEKAIKDSKAGIDRLEAIYDAASFYRDFQSIIPKMAPGILSFKLLQTLENKWLGTQKHVDLIVKGLEGNITTEMGLIIGDIADVVRKHPVLIKEFENKDYRTLLNRINNLNGYDEFKNMFNDFMKKYDMRAAGEIDMAKERWIENPEPLIRSIMATVTTSEEGVHRTQYQKTINEAKNAAIELVKVVEQKHGKLKAKIIKRLIRVCRCALPGREHPKYLIMKMIFIFKKALLEEGQYLVQNGYLTKAEDIFYLNFWEFYDVVKDPKNLEELVNIRKEEYEHFKKLSAPRVLTSDGEEIKANYNRENLPEGALVGIAVSSGIIEGIAKVITDPTNAFINKGEILVAPFTDPGWTPLFINAAGLVMEVGGLLTHGTVVAREYGIPAVVGVTDATKKIKSGQKIRVDGNGGYVVIVE